jgi:hypothetical protein
VKLKIGFFPLQVRLKSGLAAERPMIGDVPLRESVSPVAAALAFVPIAVQQQVQSSDVALPYSEGAA